MSSNYAGIAGRRSRQVVATLGELDAVIMGAVVDGADLRDTGPAALDLGHDAALYHLSSGGQRTRARLAIATSEALGLAPQAALHLAATCELLHNASLVHDDIHDRSAERRSRPSVWALYGDAVAVCAGDLLLSCAYRTLSQCGLAQRLPALFELTHRATAAAIRGQCGDLASKSGAAYTLDEYRRIAAAKSGALLALPVSLALAAAGHAEHVALAERASASLAAAYQAIDDLADVAIDVCPDATQASGSGSLNIVEVLAAAGHGSAAEGLARSFAQDCIREAAELAAGLPQGCGAGMLELCRVLGEQV